VFWNATEFIQPAGGTPSTAIDSMFERDIESGAINACLAARNYFECLHFSGGSDRQRPAVRA
jgi:hypothetical protein